MSTLKKVLALTVVFAFAFTMMAGAATNFTDNSSITNTDQVNLVNALGIMVGYPDGSFGAAKTITRAEAAKMMYVLKTGKDQGSGNYVSAANPFTDVPSNYWARGYINYCYLNGIIAGVGDNKFDPEGSLTGAQLAKMLLIVLGYSPTKVNLTGAQWVINTMSLAFDNALFDDYTLDVSAPATRQQAAVLFYNTIMAPTVLYNADQGEYSNLTTGLTVSGSTVSTGTTYNPTVGEKYFALEVETGVLFEAGGITLEGGVADTCSDGTFLLDVSDPAPSSVADFGAGTVKTFEDDDYSTAAAQAYLGQTVKVVYDTKNDKMYSIVPAKKNVVINTTAGAVSSNGSGSIGKTEYQFKISGKLYSKDADFIAFDIGNDSDPSDLRGGTNFKTDGSTPGVTTFAGLNHDGVNSMDAIKVVDFDGDGDIDIIYGTESTFGYVSFLDSKSIDFGIGSVDLLDNAGDKQVFATGVTEGSYVTWYRDVTTGNYYVKPCTVVTGTVDGIRSTDIRVNGTYYGQCKFSEGIEDAEGGITAPVPLPDVNDSVTVYTDGKYWLGFTVGSSTAAGDYCYVVDADPKTGSFNDAQVEVWIPGEDDTQVYDVDDGSTYYLDSTHKTQTLPLDSGISAFKGDYFAYSIKSDGSIELNQNFDHYIQGATVSYDEDSDVFTVGGTSYLLASDAVIFYKNTTSGKVSVLGPSDFDASFSSYDITFNYTTSGSFKYIQSGIISDASPVAQGGANSDIKYAYTTGTSTVSKNSDDNTVVEYALWTNGAAATLKQIDPDYTVTCGSRAFISYKLGSDGNIKPSYKVLVGAATKSGSTISGIGGYLDVNGTPLDLTDDVPASRYGAIAGYSSSTGMITIDLNKSATPVQSVYKITSDTVVMYVNNLNAAGATGSSYPRVSATDVADGIGNCFFVVDSDHPTQLAFLAIDTSGTFVLK